MQHKLNEMPAKMKTNAPEGYNIYPYHSLGSGKINNGYLSLAIWLMNYRLCALDGYVGVFWGDIRKELQLAFDELHISVKWIETKDFLKSHFEIEQLVTPFLGYPGDPWGTKCTLDIRDFYRPYEQANADSKYDLTIILGTVSAMMARHAVVVYFDLPKNELQLRARAGSIKNLGSNGIRDPLEMYKRFYFVDWVVLNDYKQGLCDRIDVFADTQWGDQINWGAAHDLKAGLRQLAASVFRVKPWFEPGAWGGQWLKEHIPGIGKNDRNLAWSFELIVPENGIVFEGDGYLLEVSFDMLMFCQHKMVLGKHASQYGNYFPIRFDFLDTWQGGNLSIQCHPSLGYIQQYFGESITQDETYYILEADENACVYLGFQEDIDPVEFRKQLEYSRDRDTALDITRYVQMHQAKKHDLFLIPNGTVHSAGAGNLVLEISATPYIFTFKMYDWLRLDLNGKPRPISLEHAFNNLRFDRKGLKVIEELIAKPSVIGKGPDWRIIHLPTHEDHFYDVHRIEFDSSVSIATEDVCHVLMLVEGEKVEITTATGAKKVYHYAETFVIPAGAAHYTLQNRGRSTAKVIKAFLKQTRNGG